MRTTKLRPAVVATVSAGLLSACASSEPGVGGPTTATAEARETATASARPEASLAVAEPGGAKKPTRKRVRTTPRDAIKRGPVAAMKGPLTALNPKDSAGRTIFVGFEDACYVEVPWQDERAKQPLPPGGRAVDFVPIDCPAALDDAAWDACASATLFSTPGSATCVCNPGWGNPPPPPTEVPCPK